jgi:hypothetical protein
MYAFIALSAILFFSLIFAVAYTRRDEIAANWTKYRDDPFFIFASALFKPDDDPRTRFQFMTDNFKDYILMLLNQVFIVFMAPLFKIFGLLTGSLNDSANGLFNMRALLAKMYEKMNAVVDIFMRRFHATFHSLRMTYLQLFNSLEKAYGVAVGAVYAGISVIETMMNSFQLMINISIAILVILLVLVVFAPFLILPSLPLIILAIQFIRATGQGGAVGGMEESFCFDGTTRVLMRDGGACAIKDIACGMETKNGGRVLGVLEFKHRADDLYDLWGVTVSGTHIVHDMAGAPIHVAEHVAAQRLAAREAHLYCLITSDHTIPVLSNNGELTFADWEELETTEELCAWRAYVEATLNGAAMRRPPSAVALNSEAAFSGRTRILTPIGVAEIRGVRPGDCVCTANGAPTRVVGVVRLDAAAIAGCARLDADAYASAGAWIYDDAAGAWTQPAPTMAPTSRDGWYQLFTEEGTFALACGVGARDFSDVGSARISETYGWVQAALRARTDDAAVAKFRHPTVETCPPELHSY